MNLGRGGFYGGEEDNLGVINAGKSVADRNFSSSSSSSTSSSSPIPQTIHQMSTRWRPEGETGEDNSTPAINLIEREHMFDKVVTPSDVGKLNRLVIPKQNAEKYFPLDPSSSSGVGEKGLILDFEDVRTGKMWKFRYSYWNSSQSYVMTKGWSRFVKEKRLDAGDVVSFHRGAVESTCKRLFIDWKRRISTTYIPPFPHFPFTTAAVASPCWVFPPINTPGINFVQNNTSNYNNNDLAVGPAEPVVYDSVPVVHGKAAAKRLRLFGVNMDCPVPDSSNVHDTSSSSNSHQD